MLPAVTKASGQQVSIVVMVSNSIVLADARQMNITPHISTMISSWKRMEPSSHTVTVASEESK